MPQRGPSHSKYPGILMRPEDARPVRLADYRPPEWLGETLELDIALDPEATRARATLARRPNANGAPPAPLVLDGEALALQSIRLDGVPLPAEQYVATPTRLPIAP